jgi:hypothetical protein
LDFLYVLVFPVPMFQTMTFAGVYLYSPFVIVCWTCPYFLDFLSPCYLILSPSVTVYDHTDLFRMNTCRNFSELLRDSISFHILLLPSISFHHIPPHSRSHKQWEDYSRTYCSLLKASRHAPLLIYIYLVIQTTETLSLSFVYTIQVVSITLVFA